MSKEQHTDSNGESGGTMDAESERRVKLPPSEAAGSDASSEENDRRNRGRPHDIHSIVFVAERLRILSKALDHDQLLGYAEMCVELAVRLESGTGRDFSDLALAIERLHILDKAFEHDELLAYADMAADFADELGDIQEDLELAAHNPANRRRTSSDDDGTVRIRVGDKVVEFSPEMWASLINTVKAAVQTDEVRP